MSALDELREGLREAARRDVEAGRVRLRRRRRRALGAVAALLLGGAAAAGAADLIAVGEPVPETRQLNPDFQAAGDQRLEIVAKADSGDPKLPYAVGTYTARNGQRCVLAGQLRGSSLGKVTNGVFRPYAPETGGACGRPGRRNVTQAEYNGRVLLYGVGDRRDRVVRVAGAATPVRLGRQRAFLLVFSAPRRFSRAVDFG